MKGRLRKKRELRQWQEHSRAAVAEVCRLRQALRQQGEQIALMDATLRLSEGLTLALVERLGGEATVDPGWQERGEARLLAEELESGGLRLVRGVEQNAC